MLNQVPIEEYSNQDLAYKVFLESERVFGLSLHKCTFCDTRSWAKDSSQVCYKCQNEYKKCPILYFECHLNIEPVFDSRREELEKLAAEENFKVAKLMMEKSEHRKNSFCIGHSKSFIDIRNRMTSLIEKLKKNGFKIYRYKIETAVVDSRISDSLNLL